MTSGTGTPDLLTVKETANKLRVTTRTIYRWLDDEPSRLKASKVGGQWLIPSTSIPSTFNQIMGGHS